MTVSQGTELTAVHAQVLPVPSEKLPVDAAAPTLRAAGSTVKLQVDVVPACVSVKVSPPTVIVAVREDVVVLAEAL